MAKVINLGRVRKANKRRSEEAQAEANRRKHGRTKAEKQAVAAEEARALRAHQGRQRVGHRADEPLSRALCSRCLAPVPVPAGIDLAGLVLRTVYASDDLAFPAAAMPKHPVHCRACCSDAVALVVQASVAESVAARREASATAEE